MSAAPSSAPTLTHDRPAVPTRAAAVLLGAVAAALGAGELLVGGFLWWATATDPSDDPLVGIGYLLALFAAVPGGLGLLFGGLGVWLSRRTAGLALAIIGILAIVGPLLLLVPVPLSTF